VEIGQDAHWVLNGRLLISRAPRSRTELGACARLGITHVLSLVEPGQEQAWARDVGLRLLAYPIDEMGPPSLSEVATAVGIVASVLASKKNALLLHCHAGVGRSAAVAASYIGATAGLGPEEAVQAVRSRRPVALWSPDKVGAVEEYLRAFAQGTVSTEGSHGCRKCGTRVLAPSVRCYRCSGLLSLDAFFGLVATT
jgi:protein-tyrosine phosphatase